MNDELKALGDEYWAWQMETSPLSALMLGDHTHADRFDEFSRQAEDQQISALQSFEMSSWETDNAL